MSKLLKSLRTLIVACLILLLNFPILVMVNTSLQTYYQTLDWPPQWFHSPLQWDNYKNVLTGTFSVARPLMNSLIISVATMIICTLVAVFAAYSLSRFQFRGRKWLLYLILGMQMLSPILLVTPLYTIFNRLGLIDTLLSLIIANTATSLPMSIWLMYTYLNQVPIDLEEAARLDGGTRQRVLLEIVIPSAFPGIVTVGIFAFISAWGDIVFARMSILSKELRPISMALMDFESLYKTSWELQMAASTLSVLPIFILFIYVQKYLGRHLTSAGGK
ncbi:carbohydrate ABC transporter permease [Facklamia languida]